MGAWNLAKRVAARVRAERERGSPLARIAANLPASWASPEHTSDAKMVFIGGCPRSGTSLLREMLGRHPRLAIGPEGGFFHQRPKIDRLAVQWALSEDEVVAILRASPSRTAFIEAMAAVQMERSGKLRYVEKTPINCQFVSEILGTFPNGRFIHIIRDGRDVACSLRTYGGAKLRNGKIETVEANNDIAGVARFWANEVSLGMATRDHPHCLEVRYEALVADPAAELRRICDFLGEDYDPALLDPSGLDTSPVGAARFAWNKNAGDALDTTRTGRWKRDLDLSERRVFAYAAGALLIALGYANDDAWMAQ